jgi:hypothetical protein
LVSQNAAAASATLASNQTAYLAGKNRLINGGMLVQQRASASFSNAVGYGNCDRWKCSNISAGTIALSSAHFNDENGVSTYYHVATATTAATNLSGSNQVQPCSQLIEGVNAYDLLGKQVTLSFTIRAKVTGTYNAAIFDGTGANSCVKTFVVTAADTAQRVSLTFPAIPSNAGIPDTTGGGLNVVIGAVATGVLATTPGSWVAGTFIATTSAVNWAATTNNYVAVTKAQLEEGAVATPFERRQYGEELALCQRYYETGISDVIDAGGASGTFVGDRVPFKVTKRAPATIGTTRTVTAGVQTTSNVASSSVDGFSIFATTTGTGSLQFTDSWTASAEL